jgi:hypothetical protein
MGDSKNDSLGGAWKPAGGRRESQEASDPLPSHAIGSPSAVFHQAISMPFLGQKPWHGILRSEGAGFSQVAT